MNQADGVIKTHIHKFPLSNINLLRVRFVLLAVMLTTHLYLIAHLGLRWFSSSIIFLSNWGFWTTNCYFILVLLKFPDRQVTRNFASFFHTLLSMEFVITIVFWTVLYSDPHYDKRDKAIQTIAIHGIPLTCLLIDFCFNRLFVCKRSFKYLLAVGCFYSIFNMIMVLFVLGRPIYPPLTWKDWNSVLFSFLSVTLQLVAWSSVLMMQKVKYRKVKHSGDSLIDIM